MGRRPNAVVSQYFVRGEKLGDASNRYSHTCRRCGEVVELTASKLYRLNIYLTIHQFPKGRVDNLVAHLVKRCPSIPSDERELISEAVQQGSEVRRRAQQTERPCTPPALQLVDYTADLHPSFLPTRDDDRLHTLAEVSRLAGGNIPRQTATGNDLGHGVTENEFVAQLQTAADTTEYPNERVAQPTAAYENHDTGQPSQVVDAVNAALVPSPLMQTASAANQELAHFEPQDLARSDERRQSNAAAAEEFMSYFQPVDANVNHSQASWGPTNASNSQAFGDMTATMHVSESSDGSSYLQTTSRNRNRSQFNDARRKEVQEIRKEGACMRCRMLKKPCTKGTPCKTCENVESARLWKGACVRMRLADVFTLWSTGLFHAKAKIEVPAAVRGLEQQRTAGRIEVRIFLHSDLAVTFPVRRYASGLVKYRFSMEENIAPHLRDKKMNAICDDGSDTDVWLLDESEGMSTKIEEYLNRVGNACIAEEPSPFLKATLQRAQEMARQDQANGHAALQAQSGRSSYAVQNDLLKDTVELWVATYLLTLRTPSDLEAIYNPAEAPSSQSTISQWAGQSKRQYTSLPLRSRELIFAQLRAATEHRCLNLAKAVMNELERRLLQRGQVSGFATVISSTVLLSCIERMTGLYRSFDPDPSPPPQTRSNITEETTATQAPPKRPPNWPLDPLPRALWPQGERFADLLLMLLRTRNLPPALTTTAEGRLVVSHEQKQPFNINRSVKEQTDDIVKSPAAWLNRLSLQESELVKIRDSRMPTGERGPRGWDLRFISRLLLPEASR